MNLLHWRDPMNITFPQALLAGCRAAATAALLVLAACGGGGSGTPAPAALAPTFTQQPATLSVTEGQPASFTVAATGTPTLAFQWQRNGTDIPGANGSTYTLTATTLADSGAAFRAVVANAAGSATSDAATLTVTVSVPVLTITLQPTATSVVAGSPASFAVAATCSAGTLAQRWQRGQTSGGILAWTDIAGATASTYSVTTVLGDNGAQFRAVLDCGGLSVTTSQAALLSVTPPPAVTMSLLPIVGLRAQAELFTLSAIDQEAAGSFVFVSANRIKRLSADRSSITPVAGATAIGSVDGAPDDARFFQPLGLTHDAAGNVYVADTSNFTIRHIAPDGTVSTIAGTAGVGGTADGNGAAARFSRTSAIAMGPDGDLYVADYDNHRIRRVNPSGAVSTYAGSAIGYVDGASADARFTYPSAVAVAANGDVYVADSGNSRIRRIVRSGNSAGVVQTLAGSGATNAASPDGIGTAAIISGPNAMVLRGGTLTVRDGTGLLRQIDLASAAVTTLSGSRTLGAGYADGTAAAARVHGAGGITTAANGGFMLAEIRALREVDSAGTVHTLASGFAQGMTATGTGVLAQMPFASLASESLQAVTVDPAGNVVVFERQTRLVRRISPSGVVTLAAGLTAGPGAVDMLDGVGSAAQFASETAAIASDSAGVLYLGDNYGVRRIAPDNSTTLLAGSRSTAGGIDGSAGNARFGAIWGLAVRPNGELVVGDGNNAVRLIDSAGNVSTYAGALGSSGSADGASASARFTAPRQVAFAPDGSLYVVDRSVSDATIRKVSADGSTVSTLPLPANSQVTALAVDAAGTLYYGSNTTGLMRLPAGGTPSVLVPHGAGVQLGANPTLWNIDGIAVRGAGQLVVLSSGQILLVTLP